jgi:hypothetical protein
MGHADSSMAAVYRQKVFDKRLLAVVNHVRQELLIDSKAEVAA